MEFDEFFENMERKAKKLKMNITREQANKFYTYMNLLIEWNKKINLTTIVESEDIINKHFIDSMTIIPYLDKQDTIVDIGTGAGFPGIPVAIMRKENMITLVDSLNKRISFLNEVKGLENIENIKNVHSRAEDFAKDNREKFDIATSRAVASLPILLEYLLPLVKVGGKCICMKGAEVEEELKLGQKAIEVLGGKIEKIDNFTLPETNISRNIIIIKKIRKTPEKYPRKAGTPTKEPIC